VTADDSCLWSHLPHAKLNGCEMYLCDCYAAPRSSTVNADIRSYTALQLVTMRTELDPSQTTTSSKAALSLQTFQRHLVRQLLPQLRKLGIKIAHSIGGQLLRSKNQKAKELM